MAIQSNFPSIRPSLLLDFANSKRLDPRVTFTRASTATYYDGVTTAKAEENLLLRSQDYSATWTVTNLTPVTGKTAPDATSTATEMTAGAANATITQSVTAIAADYTFSVWIRRVTGTGNVDISAHSGGTWVTQTISGTWARYTVTQTLTAGARTPGIRVVTSGDAIEIWGAQIEQRSAATAYTATTTQAITNYVPRLLTAAAGVARFDHNPVTGESLGLLIEQSRVNLALRSQEFGTTWTTTRGTITADTAIAPDGTLTADKIRDTTDNDTHFTSQTFTGTAAAYTFSVFAKAGSRSFIALRLFNGTSQVGLAYYNLGTGATGTVTAGTATITNVGNGWYRCGLTATLAASASCAADIYLASADNTNSYAGNGYSGAFLWGAQVELAPSPSSYIATAGSTVTRQIDAATMTGSNLSSWFNLSEGTLYGEAAGRIPDAGDTTMLAGFDNGSFAQRIHFAFAGATTQAARFQSFVNSVGQADIVQAGAITPNQFVRIGAVYKVNDFALYSAGTLVGTDTSGTVPTFITVFNIGSRLAGTNAFLNGTIRKLAYYPTRLTNAQLSAITG
jgi:hypothetical protein